MAKIHPLADVQSTQIGPTTAVEEIFSVGEDGEFEVTDGCAMHQIPFYGFFSIAQAHSDEQA